MARRVKKTLSNPYLEIDDNPVSIIPNTFNYRPGWGNVNVKVQSAGGNSIETVTSEDATTKKSMVKFQMENTEDNITISDTWFARRSTGQTIEASEGRINKSFDRMVLTTDPDRAIGADGNIELTWEGPPIV